MNLKFWKHKKKEEVIDHNNYQKLPEAHRENYWPTDAEPTHTIEEDDEPGENDDGFVSTLIATELMADNTDSNIDTGSTDTPADSGFSGLDGGSGGGGGADSTF